MRKWPFRPGGLAALVLLVSFSAAAHARGFHKKVAVVVHPTTVQVLVVMDIDGGGLRTQMLRTGADANHDGLLDATEAQTLKAQLVDLARRPLQLSLSGYVLRPKLVDAKLGLRDDRRTSDTGLSIAAVLEAPLPQPVFGGMELIVEDEAPDASHVRVEAEQDTGVPDAGPPPSAAADLQPGERLTLKLQSAM
ncbi:MAG: hypothetical protein IRZ16_24140 [Myxococcaceae bacterium]|nr:hypothetical protein [Myxococcaceae bacterium]